jgi:FkbH-like protein
MRTPPRQDDETLLDLHHAGKLVSRYPAVRGLLAGLSDTELVSAGRLLSLLDPDDVLREHPAVPAVATYVTGHGTLAQLTAPLVAEFARHGLLARVTISDFDAYVFDLGDPESGLYAADPELTLCVLDPMVIWDEVPVPWRPADVERVAEEKYRLIERLVARFQAGGRGTLVLNTVPLLRSFSAQLVDHRSRARLAAVWRAFNTRLLGLAETYPSAVVLDLDPLIAGGIAAADARLSRYAKAHLSPALLARYAREVGHLARHVTGRTKKALALDLDGTLWGGVLGEDGADGIELTDGYRGEAYRAFQRVVKQLGAQGVLLGVVSKNDPEPVAAVFRDHPGMCLGEDDLVRIVTNWRPKHDNLAELAAALNLGVDAFVFADDSAYECGLVSHGLPGVAVVRLGDEPALHGEDLLLDGWFDTQELTTEDRTRVAKYRDELVRKDFLDGFDSLDDYLRELQVRIRLDDADEAEVPRVSQLTLRTNQFNMTTLRLQPGDLRALLADPATRVVTVRTGDRFGDNGLVGAVFLRRDGDTTHIDNFVLSCRVFSRGIEQACLTAVLRYARAAGATRVMARHRVTAKNGKVKDFYPRNGFATVTDDGTTASFRHDLSDIPLPPSHIQLTDRLGDGTS